MTMHRTGGEIDALCTKCRLVLAHTIIALVGGRPVRVKCNTCGGEHNYRAPASEAVKRVSAPRPAATTTSRSARLSFDELIAQRSSVARPYSPKTSFLVDEVVQHPTFGRGFVTGVRPDKVEIVFRAGIKTLVHGRG